GKEGLKELGEQGDDVETHAAPQ
ncbi:MAG: hypothetical protein RJB64_1199, partial [Pseudomonadota bacterium]